jgi:hypothetical protein
MGIENFPCLELATLIAGLQGEVRYLKVPINIKYLTPPTATASSKT